MKFLRSLLLAVPFAALAMGAAYAQQATPVQQSGSRLDAAQVFFAPTPSINQAQTTITMPAVSGQCAYVDSLLVSVGQNATGATGVLTFTTTNLGGVARWLSRLRRRPLISASSWSVRRRSNQQRVVSRRRSYRRRRPRLRRSR